MYLSPIADQHFHDTIQDIQWLQSRNLIGIIADSQLSIYRLWEIANQLPTAANILRWSPNGNRFLLINTNTGFVECFDTETCELQSSFTISLEPSEYISTIDWLSITDYFNPSESFEYLSESNILVIGTSLGKWIGRLNGYLPFHSIQYPTKIETEITQLSTIFTKFCSELRSYEESCIKSFHKKLQVIFEEDFELPTQKLWKQLMLFGDFKNPLLETLLPHQKSFSYEIVSLVHTLISLLDNISNVNRMMMPFNVTFKRAEHIKHLLVEWHNKLFGIELVGDKHALTLLADEENTTKVFEPVEIDSWFSTESVRTAGLQMKLKSLMVDCDNLFSLPQAESPGLDLKVIGSYNVGSFTCESFVYAAYLTDNVILHQYSGKQVLYATLQLPDIKAVHQISNFKELIILCTSNTGDSYLVTCALDHVEFFETSNNQPVQELQFEVVHKFEGCIPNKYSRAYFTHW
ncbi:hypothetical protein BC833DRAFT_566216 [Globomyces pollinis-pini]|nr:hypothetical protein BC833DRAFT_566216 [Globomyces pollinis-pini]